MFAPTNNSIRNAMYKDFITTSPTLNYRCRKTYQTQCACL